MVGRHFAKGFRIFFCRRQQAVIGSRRCDAPGIHERHCSHLALARFGTFAVREIAGRVADGQAVIVRRITGAEAGSAERGLDDGACRHEIGQHALPGKIHIDRHGGRIHVEGEFARADGSSAQQACCGRHVDIVAAGAAADDALLDLEPAVLDLVDQGVGSTSLGHFRGFLFGFAQDIFQIGIQLVDFIGIGRMERQCDHRLYRGKIHPDTPVIVSDFCRIELLIIAFAVMFLQECMRILIRAPHGGQAGRFRRHDIHGIAVIGGHAGHAGSDEFHDLVLYVAVLIDRPADGQCNIVGSHPGLRLAREINGYDAGIGVVPGIPQDLLVQFTAAFTDGHGPKSAVTRMGIGAQDHLAAAGVHFTHVLMDDGHMGRYIDTTVLPGCRQAEKMVILIDGAAHSAKGVMAAGQDVRYREGIHARCFGSLDDPHVRNVVACQGIEADLQLLHIVILIVCLQDAVGDRPLTCFFFSDFPAQHGLRSAQLFFRQDFRSTDQIGPVLK